MHLYKKVAWVVFIMHYACSMEQKPDSILDCVTHAQTIIQACNYAIPLINTQSTARKITTELFLTKCQEKFHRSMYEIGLSMATHESLQIAEELAKQAEQVWHSKPHNKHFAEYLFDREEANSHKLPSFLYYAYNCAPFSHLVHVPISSGKKVCFQHTVLTKPSRLTAWMESGILQNKEYIGILFNHLILNSLHNDIKDFEFFIAQLDCNAIVNVEVRKGFFKKMTPLDYAMHLVSELPNQYTSEATGNSLNQPRMQMIRILIKHGAKSVIELQGNP